MATSGPNFASTITDLGGGTGGSWAGNTAANLNSDNDVYAVWSKTATANIQSSLQELSSFGTFSGVTAANTINFVRITVNHFVAQTARMQASQFELWNSNTSQIGTTQTGTESATTTTTDTFDFTGVTFSQLANLRVRFRARGDVTNAQTSSASFDYVSLTVDYTPALVGQVTEADTAQPISRKKLKILGTAYIDSYVDEYAIALETDTAQTVTRVKTKVLAQAIETDTAQSIVEGVAVDPNAAPTIKIERCGPDGTPISTIVSETLNQGAGEISTADGGSSISVTIPAGSVTDTALNPGDRLRVSLWIDDAADQGGTGNMVSGGSVQFYINGPVGSQGQSRVTFAETLTQFVGTGATVVGKATETDIAQAITRHKTKAIGQATDVSLAQAITRRKTKLTNQATETDLAQVVARPGQVNRATETDVAQAVTRVKSRVFGQAIETDISTSTIKRKTRLVAQALETNSSTATAKKKLKAFAQAVENDLAQPIALPGRIRQATENDIAQPITRTKRRTVGQAIETDAPQALVRVKSKSFAQASEIDTAQRILRPGRINQATELDVAQPITHSRSKTVGQALQTSVPQALIKIKSKSFSQALETDSAQRILRPGRVNQVTETDTAQPISRIKRKIIGQATASNLSNVMVRRKSKSLTQPIETDLARQITFPGRVAKVIETDLAQPITRVKRKTLGLTSETNLATSTGRIHQRTIGRVTEADSVFAFARKKTWILGRATETDLSMPMEFGGLGSALTMVAAYPSYHSVAGYHTGLVGYVLEHEFLAAAGELAEV